MPGFRKLFIVYNFCNVFSVAN